MKNKHILVVEDEKHLADGIKFNLEAEGYHVSTVGDGPSALRLITGKSTDVALIDLMILDLMLPGMSGYAVCQRLREQDIQVPILILSARTLSEDRTRGFDVGANQYLTKPFELDELLSRVKNLLTIGQRPPAAPPVQLAVYDFHDVQVDFRTHQVTRDGSPVRLTHRELQLLRYFVENPDRVISRQELLENVWDMPATMNTRAVDQFIRRLRKYFEPNPKSPRFFLTVRDAGYRFVPGGEAEPQVG